MITLTHQQNEVYQFLVSYIGKGKTAPSLDEIAEALGLASKSGVHRLMNGLIERGYIRRLDGKSRAIEIIAHDDPTDQMRRKIEEAVAAERNRCADFIRSRHAKLTAGQNADEILGSVSILLTYLAEDIRQGAHQ